MDQSNPLGSATAVRRHVEKSILPTLLLTLHGAHDGE